MSQARLDNKVQRNQHDNPSQGNAEAASLGKTQKRVSKSYTSDSQERCSNSTSQKELFLLCEIEF